VIAGAATNVAVSNIAAILDRFTIVSRAIGVSPTLFVLFPRSTLLPRRGEFNREKFAVEDARACIRATEKKSDTHAWRARTLSGAASLDEVQVSSHSQSRGRRKSL
jgi:hypothetical protein